jgi:hypothetical protein
LLLKHTNLRRRNPRPVVGTALAALLVGRAIQIASAVSIIKPSVAMGMIDNQKLESVAREVEEKLNKVFDDIA